MDLNLKMTFSTCEHAVNIISNKIAFQEFYILKLLIKDLIFSVDSEDPYGQNITPNSRWPHLMSIISQYQY